jgi:hypothetical protein
MLETNHRRCLFDPAARGKGRRILTLSGLGDSVLPSQWLFPASIAHPAEMSAMEWLQESPPEFGRQEADIADIELSFSRRKRESGDDREFDNNGGETAR